MTLIEGKALVTQSGGPTAVIDSVAAGVMRTALNNPHVCAAMP